MTTVDERAATGRAARTSAPRSSHAALEPAAGRDPIGLLEAQARTRVRSLIPIRYGRMAASPFAFFRGAAAIMAHDLAHTPSSGLDAQLCGDAHLDNFGGFASPERDLVFDLNDFDETYPGPFEWDVKRLAASFEVAARQRSFGKADRREAVLEAVRAYREAMRRFATIGDLDVWYARLDAQTIEAELRNSQDRKLAQKFERSAAKAEGKDSLRALGKLTEIVDGKPRFVSRPPLIVPVADLDADEQSPFEGRIEEILAAYSNTLQADRRRLFGRFRQVDLARKVVGVGSVGTRCWVVYLVDGSGDPLFLQIKEADASVLLPHAGATASTTNGQRVVEGQRLMQAASDIFLGWLQAPSEVGVTDFYVRQLWDWKTSFDAETILPRGFRVFANGCGWTLARAHARSGDRVAIAAYLGKSDRFDRAVADFAASYADVNERDHRALREAVATGRIAAVEGV